MIQKSLFFPVIVILILLSSFLVSWQPCCAAVTTRSSIVGDNGGQGYWVAVDFKIPPGEHVTAPGSKWDTAAPRFNWKNAKILNVVWPASEVLSGEEGYRGYSKDFSVLFYLKHEPVDLRLEGVTSLRGDLGKDAVACEVFYVLCGTACLPVTEKVVVKNDGLLKQEEIKRALEVLSDTGDYGFFLVLAMAFLGGLILNCMPCVFPILSIKIFSLLKHGGKLNRQSLIIQGCLFTIGTIATFSFLGTILFFLKEAGESVGWGFYMQNPIFVLLLLLIFICCALYFFEVFTFPAVGFINKIGESGKLYVNAFLNGVFTSVASGVCVGPFLGVALSSALAYDDYTLSLAVFSALGLGVASPFLAISTIPHLYSLLPSPGAWMKTIKEFMGFAMILSCVWLMYTLCCQIPINDAFVVIGICVCFAMFVWLFGKLTNSRIGRGLVAICILTSFNFAWRHIADIVVPDQQRSQIVWEPFSFERFENLKKDGKAVFINFTASWCLTCSLNKSVLESKEVADAFKEHGVVALVADWTNESKEIADALSMFGYNSIPLYVYYSPTSHKTIILPSLLRISDIISSLPK
jgi:thiol:disulfide interchange protein